jgi:hypothetical protein
MKGIEVLRGDPVNLIEFRIITEHPSRKTSMSTCSDCGISSSQSIVSFALVACMFTTPRPVSDIFSLRVPPERVISLFETPCDDKNRTTDAFLLPGKPLAWRV